MVKTNAVVVGVLVTGLIIAALKAVIIKFVKSGVTTIPSLKSMVGTKDESVKEAVVGVTVLGDTLSGGWPVNVSVAIVGVSVRGTITFGVKVVNTKTFVVGVATVAFPEIASGSNVVSVKAVVVGTTTWFAVAITFGVYVVNVNAVTGVTIVERITGAYLTVTTDFLVGITLCFNTGTNVVKLSAAVVGINT